MSRFFSALIFLWVLAGCSKPPDLDSPCTDFGKFCPQQPVNIYQ